jgi:hypothetical protein
LLRFITFGALAAYDSDRLEALKRRAYLSASARDQPRGATIGSFVDVFRAQAAGDGKRAQQGQAGADVQEGGN